MSENLYRHKKDYPRPQMDGAAGDLVRVTTGTNNACEMDAHIEGII